MAPDGPFLDIPWLMTGALVLVLPLVTAAIVGVSAVDAPVGGPGRLRK